MQIKGCGGLAETWTFHAHRCEAAAGVEAVGRVAGTQALGQAGLGEPGSCRSPPCDLERVTAPPRAATPSSRAQTLDLCLLHLMPLSPLR